MDLALIHETSLVLVDVLDRILDGDDVLAPLGVDLVDHRRERRGLAAAGRAGDEHEPARALGQVGDDRRQAELVEWLDLFGNDPVDGRDGAPLIEHVAAKPRHAPDAEREVELEGLLEAFLLRVGQDAVGERLGVGGAERRQIEDLQLPVHADLRRRLRRQVQVGAAVVDQRLE